MTRGRGGGDEEECGVVCLDSVRLIRQCCDGVSLSCNYYTREKHERYESYSSSA